MEEKSVRVNQGCVGLQIREGKVLESVLPCGEHRTDVEVIEIQLRWELPLSLSGHAFDERFRLSCELDGQRLPSLYKQADWLPVRLQQLGEFIAPRAAALLREQLLKRSRTLGNLTQPSAGDFVLAFRRHPREVQDEICAKFVDQLKQEVGELCQGLLVSASVLVASSRRR